MNLCLCFKSAKTIVLIVLTHWENKNLTEKRHFLKNLKLTVLPNSIIINKYEKLNNIVLYWETILDNSELQSCNKGSAISFNVKSPTLLD